MNCNLERDRLKLRQNCSPWPPQFAATACHLPQSGRPPSVLTTAAPAAFCVCVPASVPLPAAPAHLQPVWMVINLEGKIKGSYTADKMIEFTRRCVCGLRQPRSHSLWWAQAGLAARWVGCVSDGHNPSCRCVGTRGIACHASEAAD